MKKVIYSVELTLPNKSKILFKDLNNEKLIASINEAISKHYGFPFLKINKNHLDNLKTPDKRRLGKLLKHLLKLVDFKTIKSEDLQKYKIKYKKTKKTK